MFGDATNRSCSTKNILTEEISHTSKNNKTFRITKNNEILNLKKALSSKNKIIIDLPDHQREQLIRQLQSFPLGKRDDIIDACAYAYNYLSVTGDGTIKTAGKRKRRKI
jgi:phage terminase large subunit-like protein